MLLAAGGCWATSVALLSLSLSSGDRRLKTEPGKRRKRRWKRGGGSEVSSSFSIPSSCSSPGVSASSWLLSATVTGLLGCSCPSEITSIINREKERGLDDYRGSPLRDATILLP